MIFVHRPTQRWSVPLAAAGLGLAATIFTSLPPAPAAADAGSAEVAAALTAEEQALLDYDRRCEALAVDDCAQYDGGYDPNWRLFEDPVTGEDYPSTQGDSVWTLSAGLISLNTTSPRWVCSGNTDKPVLKPVGTRVFIVGVADQVCSGNGWQRQRVITAVQWKHTKRFARDHWDTVSQTDGGLSYDNIKTQDTTRSCPGTRKRTFRTVGVGYAAEDTYGGPYGGGREDSKEQKLTCDLTLAH